jgi:Pectate lyase superfamily protein
MTRAFQPSAFQGPVSTFQGVSGCDCPFVNIRDFGAKGDGSTDDSGAIQAAINSLGGASGGGFLFVPPGNYRVGTTIDVNGAIAFRGPGMPTTSLSALGDITVLNFGPYSGHSTVDGLWILGLQAGNATKNAVVVADNMPVHFSNSHIWGGNWALETGGVDGAVNNCFIMGAGSGGGGILSRGANWYNRAKLDTIGFAVAAGFMQLQGNAFAPSAENHFLNSDFSGLFQNSIVIADPSNGAMAAFTNCVMSTPISVTGARHTRIAACELGANVTTSAPISVVGSYGVTPVTVFGPKAMAGNVNIT